jgi:hypothetical protein
MYPNYGSLTDSKQVPLLPSSENDAWEINNRSIAVTQQLQGSNHWETLELYLVCAFSVFLIISVTVRKGLFGSHVINFTRC